jgi:hypothetical protein
MAIPMQLNSSNTEYPLTPALIEKINGTDQCGLNRSQRREHDRLVAGMRSRHQPGVVITVIEADGSVEMHTDNRYVIGPRNDTTEK